MSGGDSFNSRRRLSRALAAACFLALGNILLVSFSKDEAADSTISYYSSNVEQDYRQLSIDYGDGTCKWMPPNYEVPDFIDFYKTIIVGYPS